MPAAEEERGIPAAEPPAAEQSPNLPPGRKKKNSKKIFKKGNLNKN